MPLTFEEAKLQYNPDPNWFPARGSDDYKQILEIQRQSGYVSLIEKLAIPAKEIPHTENVVCGRYVNPVNKEIKLPTRCKISKADFLKIRSNASAVINHISENGPVVQIVSHSPDTQPPPLPSIGKVDRKMSKAEFMKLAGVKEYVDYHILKNKN